MKECLRNCVQNAFQEGLQLDRSNSIKSISSYRKCREHASQTHLTKSKKNTNKRNKNERVWG